MKSNTTSRILPLIFVASLVIGRGSGDPGTNVASGANSSNAGPTAGAIFTLKQQRDRRIARFVPVKPTAKTVTVGEEFQ